MQSRLLGSCCAFIVLLASAGRLGAQEPSAEGVTNLDAVVISAADAGPHVWEYQRGAQKVLVLGTIYPVPTSLDFVPATVQKSIDASSVVVGSSGVVVGEGIGLFRGLTLWSSVRKSKYLPVGRTLSDVLSPEDYRRWTGLKARYLSGNRDVERMLPMYAAWQLYEAVLERSSIEQRKVSAIETVMQLAKGKRIPVVDAKFHLAIRDPKRAIAEFAVDAEADQRCLRGTMDGIESLPGLSQQLARDWSDGNVEAMKATLDSNILPTPCWSWLTNEAIARQQGEDLDRAVRDAWIKALQEAARSNKVVFTTAPVTDVLRGTGRVAWLLSQGFTPVTEASPVPAAALD
jgi:hypothetical protein